MRNPIASILGRRGSLLNEPKSISDGKSYSHALTPELDRTLPDAVDRMVAGHEKIGRLASAEPAELDALRSDIAATAHKQLDDLSDAVDESIRRIAYVRPAVTLWKVGQRCAKKNGEQGTLAEFCSHLGVAWDRESWASNPYPVDLCDLQHLQEVPGEEYERIPARTFSVPTTTIERARNLSDAVGNYEMRENTPLSWQGYGNALDDPDWSDVFPSDRRDENTPYPGQKYEDELRDLWENIPRPTRRQLMEDYLAVGKRSDHPFAPFLSWGTAYKEFQKFRTADAGIER